MTGHRLHLSSRDAIEAKLDVLAEHFPHVVTELTAPDGRTVRGVDWDTLRQDFEHRVVEGLVERYTLGWPGKRAALMLANAPTARTLRPQVEESVDFEVTQHLFIEGDNLDTLKLLQEPLLGRVKMIYIDPPYNTGNDFIYEDDFSQSVADYLVESGQQSDEGRLVANPETSGRFHSAWLSMLYPRLRIARNLLTEDGVGFVSIDGNEVAQLKMLLAEVFGADNVVATIVWASNLKGRQISNGGPAGTHEYILCFARNAEAIGSFRGSGKEFQRLMPSVYKGAAYELKEDSKGTYVTKNELYNTNSKFNERTAPTMVFKIHYHPETADVRVTDVDDPTTFAGYITALPHSNSRPGLAWHAWRWSRAKVLADKDELEFDVAGGGLRIRTKIRDVDGMTMKDLVIGPSTQTGQADLEALGLGRVFDNPKPVSLIETLVSVATGPDDLVLDFFAGSATTAQAVLARNAADGGTRRYVLVQLDEKCAPGSAGAAAGFDTIAAIARERIRRAGESLAKGGYTGDVGFRALRLDSSTRRSVARTTDETSQSTLLDLEPTVKPDRSDADLLFAVMLDLGLDLTMAITAHRVGEHVVYDVGGGALGACFSPRLDPEVLTHVIEMAPLRAVFREAAFPTDAALTNAAQTLLQRSPTTRLATV